MASLQQRDEVDDAVGGAKAFVRLAEPVQQDAIFGHAVQHAVGADDRGVDRARKNQHAHDHHEDVEHQPQQLRPRQVHRQSAQQVVRVLVADVVGLMIMAANTVITPVQITAYQHTMLAVIRRFFSFG